MNSSGEPPTLPNLLDLPLRRESVAQQVPLAAPVTEVAAAHSRLYGSSNVQVSVIQAPPRTGAHATSEPRRATPSTSHLFAANDELPPLQVAQPAAISAETSFVPSEDDWTTVAMLREQVSAELTDVIGTEDSAIDFAQSRRIIRTLVHAENQARIGSGQPAWMGPEIDWMCAAVFDAVHRMGRLQRILDDDSIENITVSGRKVVVQRTDGSLSEEQPVARDDKDLENQIKSWVSRNKDSLSFDRSTPAVDMQLPDGSRLAAGAWILSAPTVVIRRHRLKRVVLDDLVGLGTITRNMATFLRAAVRARLSIVVAGEQGAGKTTLMRALCAEIPEGETIGTFEDTRELFLRELGTHLVVHEWQSRPPSGEVINGRDVGEYTLAQCLIDSFRYALTRQIVGEIRGAEVWQMIKAMESGAGSISSTHARDAASTFDKLVGCAMEAGVGADIATRKLSNSLDLVVHISAHTKVVVGPDGRRRWTKTRVVDGIMGVEPGENGRPSTTDIYAPHGAGIGRPAVLPDKLRRQLIDHGFDVDGFHAMRGGAL